MIIVADDFILVVIHIWIIFLDFLGEVLALSLLLINVEELEIEDESYYCFEFEIDLNFDTDLNCMEFDLNYFVIEDGIEIV